MTESLPPSQSRAPAEERELSLLLLDASGCVRGVSATAVRQLGRSAQQLQGCRLHEVFRSGTGAALPWIASLTECPEPPPPRWMELEAVRQDGTEIGFDGVLYAIATGPRAENECVAGLKIRASAGLVVKSELLAAQREVLAMVSSGAGLRETLLAVAAFAERVMPGEIFCMVSTVTDAKVFERGVCPTLPDEIATLQAGHAVGDAWSPGTLSAESGETVVAADLQAVAAWHGFAERLQRHGLIAVWSLPIRQGPANQVRAVLEFLLPMRRPPSKVELALMDELGELVHLAMDLHQVASDLADRSAAQRTAEETAEQRGGLIDAMLDATMDSVINIDLRGHITLWNRKAETLFGWSAAEVLHQPLSKFIIPPELVSAHEEGMKRFRETGHGPVLGRRIEITAIDRGGRRFPIELSINKVLGPVPFFSAYLRDISERRRAETLVKESEQRLKLVVDAIADGFWDFRLDGAGSFMSDRCATMLGYPAGTSPVVPPPEHPWVHPDDRAAVRTAWEDHLNGRASRYECEHRRLHADGGWRWILDRGRVVERDPQGRVLRISGMQADTSDRRALEASLGSAERLESLGLMASGFAQELDALLSVIRAHASLASVAPDTAPSVIESLEVIQLSVSRAKSMAQSLLGLAPGDASDHAETVSCMEVVRRTLQLLRSTLPRTVEVVVEDLSGGRDTVRVDAARLQQSIMNMLLRGCEVLAQAGRLTLRISPCGGASGPFLQIACSDHATPLTVDAQARAFEALGADGALLGRTALGMAAVKRFAESSGGAVRAQVVGDANQIAIELPLQLAGGGERGAKVVLWEEHPLLKPMLVEAFAAAGHRVTAIEREGDLLEALRRFGRGAVLVLDDRHWHGSLPQRIQDLANAPGAVSGVVVLIDRQPSAASEPGIIWLRKPYALETLLATVARVAADAAATS